MKSRHRLLACMLLAAAICQAARAAEEPAPKIDPRASQVLEALSAHFDRMQSFEVEVKSSMLIETQSTRNEIAAEYEIAGQRPNRLAIKLTRGDNGATVVCDGKQLFTYSPAMGRYTVAPAPPTLEGILHDGVWRHAQMGNAPTFAALALVFRHQKEALQGITAAEYLGIEQLGDASCHHLKVAHGPIDLELWISSGDEPVLRKVVPDMRRSLALEGATLPPGLKMSLVGLFDHWRFGQPPAAAAFAFEPPADAEKVEKLVEDEHISGHEPQKLLGKPAPPFSLKSPTGVTVLLGDLLDSKHILVLDFWATWCAPCVEGLPRVAEVAARFKDRGVLFYAINQEEDAETVNAFMQQRQLSIPTLLDLAGEASEEYKAEQIPLTVIIGKDGIVQAVHFGVSKESIARLETHLSDLLAGKQLFKEKAAKE